MKLEAVRCGWCGRKAKVFVAGIPNCGGSHVQRTPSRYVRITRVLPGRGLGWTLRIFGAFYRLTEKEVQDLASQIQRQWAGPAMAAGWSPGVGNVIRLRARYAPEPERRAFRWEVTAREGDYAWIRRIGKARARPSRLAVTWIQKRMTPRMTGAPE